MSDNRTQMKDYRIAFFTADWNYELVESTLWGLKQYVDDHKNVQLFIFDCFGKDIGNAADQSEYAVFDLPDLNRFDGIVIQGNQIVLEQARLELAHRAALAGIPAVTIDCPMEGCTLVEVDNRKAQHDIAAHVLGVHHARRLVYLTGIMDNGSPEALQRKEGFLDACREHGVPEENLLIVEGTWRNIDGVRLADRFVREKLPMPDAFICANDDMALGLIERLERNGYHIPQDVIVTGFDDIASAALSTPRLSTVHRNYARFEYLAMETVVAMIEGREDRKVIDFDYQVICSESCGCHDEVHRERIGEKYFQQTRALRGFYQMQDRMAEELFEAEDLTGLMQVVERHQQILGNVNVYMCINDYYYDNYDKEQWEQDSEKFGKEMVLTACGHPDLSVAATEDYIRFATSSLLPDRILERERYLMFYPLHYNTYSIGYLVMDGISEAANLNLHKSVFSFLEIAIENVRKKTLLRQFNDVLDNLYVHDKLTGLYNRFGYERFGQEIFDTYMEEDGSVQLLFVDIDDMKGINDRYGHRAGDNAIRAAAEILSESCVSSDFLMRYGGDEFVVIASGREKEREGEILMALASRNARGDLACPLSLSVGVVISDPGDEHSLQDYLQMADERMYARKKKRTRHLWNVTKRVTG